jgi:hypothetical protein
MLRGDWGGDKYLVSIAVRAAQSTALSPDLQKFEVAAYGLPAQILRPAILTPLEGFSAMNQHRLN